VHAIERDAVAPRAMPALDGGAAPPAPRAVTTPAGASKLVTMPPARFMDSRTGFRTADAPFAPGSTRSLQITGFGGVPAGASAVIVNITAVATASDGHITVFPAGTARPTASNLNIERAGQTRPNAAMVRLSAGGAIALFSSLRTELVVDVQGYFVPSQVTADGRFRSLRPARVLDTRVGNGWPSKVASGQTINVQIRGRGGVPSTHVAAVALNITHTQPSGGGHVTVFPTGSPAPTASNLNFLAGSTGANLVVVPVGSGGRVSMRSTASTHLLADVAGYFTDGTVPAGNDGLFVPRNPTRLEDTRCPSCPLVPAGFAVPLRVDSTAGMPATGIAAAVYNLTGTQALGSGHLTGYPYRQGQPPNASNLNLERRGSTRANLAITQMGEAGSPAQAFMLIFTSAGAHIIVDLAGYFTASGECTVRTAAPASDVDNEVQLVHAQLQGGSPQSATVTDGICNEWPFVLRLFESDGGAASVRTRRTSGEIDVAVADLPLTEAQLQSGSAGASVRSALETQGYDAADWFVLYVDAAGEVPCAATFPAARVIINWMKRCDTYPSTKRFQFPFGATYVMAHEVTHALGAVAACAPHDDGTGHVTDSNRDVLYGGTSGRDWHNLTLDVGHDDYHRDPLPACPSIENSPLWIP
jgi:hypothetical protein